MANNTTTVWRWDGRTSDQWMDVNWLDENGVEVDDWPAGSLPTHTVKFLGADLGVNNKLSQAGVQGLTGALTVSGLITDDDYGEFLLKAYAEDGPDFHLVTINDTLALGEGAEVVELELFSAQNFTVHLNGDNATLSYVRIVNAGTFHVVVAPGVQNAVVGISTGASYAAASSITVGKGALLRLLAYGEAVLEGPWTWDFWDIQGTLYIGTDGVGGYWTNFDVLSLRLSDVDAKLQTDPGEGSGILYAIDNGNTVIEVGEIPMPAPRPPSPVAPVGRF